MFLLFLTTPFSDSFKFINILNIDRIDQFFLSRVIDFHKLICNLTFAELWFSSIFFLFFIHLVHRCIHTFSIITIRSRFFRFVILTNICFSWIYLRLLIHIIFYILLLFFRLIGWLLNWCWYCFWCWCCCWCCCCWLIFIFISIGWSCWFSC